MTACGLIFGNLTADHYEDDVARNPLIDQLREKMVVEEEPRYSKDYLDPENVPLPTPFRFSLRMVLQQSLLKWNIPLAIKGAEARVFLC